ncbi:hypothetical protein KSS87_007563 [Heliosperma pusillum]|nr:hypothetical protein KSS87_021331 [Heliosperma pusillum]KAH9620159.1 hypothetical protein KSS87_007563 [Heliosperma pusillum]
MEDWLSQLDMDWNNEGMSLNSDLYMQYDQPQQEVDTFNEEIALILGDEVPSPLYEERTLPKVASSLSISSEQISPPNCNVLLNDNHVNLPQQDPSVLEHQSNKNSKQNDGNGNKRKRKREPNQIYDHIMAERKRRELLGQLFIALSAILPGLKKVDKTSILGEAIKHMKQLKEKVKTLEEAVAKQNVESMVMVKRSKMVVDNDDDSSCTVEDSYASGGSSGGDGGDEKISNSLPEIEVKASNKTVLLRVYCEKRKGISAKLLGEVEKHNIIILHSSIMPFGSSGCCNVTIVGQVSYLLSS